MPKEYVKDGTTIDVWAVDFVVGDEGTTLNDPMISDVASFRVWDDDIEDYREVKWDHSVSPARLFYAE